MAYSIQAGCILSFDGHDILQPQNIVRPRESGDPVFWPAVLDSRFPGMTGWYAGANNMQTNLADFIRHTTPDREAEEILRRCVHCGFCTATCPTYQLLGDELDGPRGRIYLIKQVLEGADPTEKTRLHLDRCLTCRSCESTCPSGVHYSRLLDIGREVVAQKVPRSGGDAFMRATLKNLLPRSTVFGAAMKLGQSVRLLLPGALRAKVPPLSSAGARPHRTHARQMIALAGCVQPSMYPNINAATRARARPPRHPDRSGRCRLLRRGAPAPQCTPKVRATMPGATSTPGGRCSKPVPSAW
jgi:heterodisulfide reductase subunit C